MFTISLGNVYKHWISHGDSQVVEYFGHEKQVVISVDRESIVANGIESATITAVWQKFNPETGKYEYDPTNTDPVTFMTPQGQVTDTDGIIEFTSMEPGEYEFSALHCQKTVKVVVTGV